MLQLLLADETLVDKLPKFCEMVNHSEHTYLFSQSLMSELAERTHGKEGLIQRISQEVEIFARTRGYAVNTAWVASIPGASKFPRAISGM